MYENAFLKIKFYTCESTPIHRHIVSTVLTFLPYCSSIESLVSCLDFSVLQAFCPVREIPKGRVHENVLEAFSIKDKVRGNDHSFAIQYSFVSISITVAICCLLL